MNVLSLDCSGPACSAAVLIGDAVGASACEEMTRGQAERLIPMVGEVLNQCDLRMADIDLVAVTIGPGAFTGVRIAISAAQGLARVNNTPIIGVSVTQALAEQVPGQNGKRLIVALDSKRPDPFCELFHPTQDGWQGEGPQMVLADQDSMVNFIGDNVEDLLIVGSAAEAVQLFLNAGQVVSGSNIPDPVLVAWIGRKNHLQGINLPAVPLYLRNPDVSAPNRDKARRPAPQDAS